MNDTKLDKAELYANTVRSFARTGGVVFLLSTDAIFADVLRRALDMVQAPRQVLRHHRSVETFLTDLREEAHNRVLVFLERMLSGQSLAPLLGSIGQICGEAAIIVLTTEIDQGSAALLIEYGAHNIITKPISVASVIEKMAFTIAPQGQMGRYIDRARRSLEMGSYEEAMRIASVVLQLKPESAVAYMLMGDAYKGMGLTSKAEEMYLKASEVAKLYIQPLKRLSSLYEEAGDKSKQLEALKRLHEISPLNTQRLLEMGALEMEVGDPTAAEGYFEQAMQTARREAAELCARAKAAGADCFVRELGG
jgi:tetratricopeptide (TPR) repeat protein